MTMPARLPLFAAALLSLSACSLFRFGETIDPPAPQAPPAPPPPPAPASTIRIPLTVELEPLARKIGGLLPDSLGVPAFEEDFGTGGPDRPSCGVGCGYRVLRDDSVTLRAEGRTVEVTAGLRYGFTCRKRFPCFGPLVTASCGWEGEPNRVRVRFTADLAVRRDWSTDLRTRLDSLDNQGACRLWRLPIYVPDRLLLAVYDNYRKAGARLDSALNAQLDLRSRVEAAWRRLSRPIPMGERVWLALGPEGLAADTPRIESGNLLLDLGLTARPRVFVGKEPESAPRPLPDLAPQRAAEGFRMHIPVHVDYAEINSVLRKVFRIDSGGTRFPKKGFPHATLDGIEMSGFGDRVLIKAHLRGAIRGNAYLVGVPIFNPVTFSLSVRDLEFDLRTRGPLLKAASWLLEGEIVETIESRAVVSLYGNVSAMRGLVERVLDRKFGALRLQGRLEGLDFRDFRFSDADSAVTVYFEAKGRLEARLGS